jgi:predicted TPR repeat methyltransferase
MTTDSSFERARQCFILGNAAFETGRLDEAETHFQASLEALPGRPSTLINLAATRLRLGRPGQAIEPLRSALAAQPGDAEAWHHLGTALLETHQHAQALQALDRALALGLRHAAAHYRRGLALVELQRQAEAAQAWELALSLDDSFTAAWVDLGSLMRDLGRPGRARECLERAIALGADDPLIRFQLAGLKESSATPEAPPRDYVEKLFDGYAEGFDSHLVGQLGYRTPQLLADGLSSTGVNHFAAALDLGCGTGLCAQPLASWVGQLDGVDLSAAMLDKARALGRYDLLAHGDVVDHLLQTQRRYALVVAADVFVYLGALEPVFEGVKRVLQPGGVFCFSVEAWDDVSGAETSGVGHNPGEASGAVTAAQPGYTLRTTLRYAHREAYVQTLARDRGFEVCGTQRHALRQDHGSTVVGLCAWLRQKSV